LSGLRSAKAHFQCSGCCFAAFSQARRRRERIQLVSPRLIVFTPPAMHSSWSTMP